MRSFGNTGKQLLLSLLSLLFTAPVHGWPVYPIFKLPGWYIAGPDMDSPEPGFMGPSGVCLFENLIGPVCTVVYEKATYSERYGKRFRSPRWLYGRVSYDARGNVTERRWYEVSSEYTYEYRYDGKWNTREVIIRKADGSLHSKKSYGYDARGRVTEKEVYGSEGSVYRKYAYVYDSRGNRISETVYNPDGSVRGKYTWIHDANGKATEKSWYGADGSLVTRTRYAYNDKGDMTEAATYRADASLDKKMGYAYDAAGNLAELISYKADGSLEMKMLFAYEARGNMVSQKSYGGEGRLGYDVLCTYEYDAIGNWVKRTKLRSFVGKGEPDYEPMEVYYRTIGYYLEEEKPWWRSALKLDEANASFDGALRPGKERSRGAIAGEKGTIAPNSWNESR